MLEDVQEIIYKEFDIEIDKLTPEANLRNDLHIDSMAAVNLSFEIEDRFKIKVTDEELAGLTTINDILKLIESKGVSGKN